MKIQACALLKNGYSFRRKERIEYEEGRTLSQSHPLPFETSSFTFLSSSGNLHCQYVDESYSNISYIWAMYLGRKSYSLSSFTDKEKALIYQGSFFFFFLRGKHE